MIKLTKNRLKAIIGTVLFHIGLLLCFIFMGLTYQIPPPPEEGITINFGYQDFGSGSEQVEQIVEEQEIITKEIVNNNPIVEDISTQNIEEIPTTKLKEQLEKPKEVKKIEKKKPEPAVNTKALYPGKKQNNSNSQGVSEGQEDQGSQDGDPNSNTYTFGGIGTNGIAYQLGGRTIAKIKKPNYDSQQQGKVVVTIRVDRSGKVISATPGAKGSTTTNAYLYSKAKEAALITTFEANTTAPEIQIGTIIYNFKLN
ncbi:energy transducer TonB [Flavobacteriales bacterium]|nr:energy transducer TonB [Flavobacteriales bacterium]